MTKRKLIRNIILISLFYILALFVGITFYITGANEEFRYFGMFKELFPIIAALPLAYLGFCFQRRSNFHSALRQLWVNMIHAVNKSILYTEFRVETEKEYLEALLLLSKSIDEVRGVYFNIQETSTDKGYYPFESLKSIYTIVEQIGTKDFNEAQLRDANAKIRDHWQTIRKTFLMEFDRSEPTFADTINN